MKKYEGKCIKVMRTGYAAQEIMEMEERFGAHNYHPLPVVLKKGKGPFVWGKDGTRYYDFLSAYSAVNQGHCHPELVKVMQEQAEVLTLTSRAFYSDQLGPYEKMMCEVFGYDKLLPMNSGAEAVETALKLARRWGYQIKSIPENKAEIIVCSGNFHGRTITIVSMSDDQECRGGFGPFTPGFVTIPFGDEQSLKQAITPNTVAFLVEPIQGEAGVIVPEEGYLQECRKICWANNIRLIADEIQTGLCRTGRMLACDHEGVRPDVLILGKALSGGMMPISAVLADNEVMLTIKPGQHGSTFGGNPLACRIATKAMEILQKENLAANAEKMGRIFRDGLAEIKSPLITTIRGKGLLNAIVIEPFEVDGVPKTAWDVCLALAKNGLLAKPTHDNIIRFAPPLVINEEQIHSCVGIIRHTLNSFTQ